MFDLLNPETWATVATYFYYDGPRVFSTRAPSGQVYLVLWNDTDDGTDDKVAWDKWLYVPVSQQRLADVEAGTVSLLEAIDRCEWPQALMITAYRDKPAHIETVLLSELNAEDKPATDSYLKLETPNPTRHVEVWQVDRRRLDEALQKSVLPAIPGPMTDARREFLVKTWEADVPTKTNDLELCRDVWFLLNQDDRPTAQTRYSLSAGDVIVVDGTAYMVSVFGFTYLPHVKERGEHRRK